MLVQSAQTSGSRTGVTTLPSMQTMKTTRRPSVSLCLFPSCLTSATAKYLGVYAGLGLANAGFVLGSAIATALGAIYASTRLHNRMLARVLRAPMAFFDTTPLGRIVNRFSKDVLTIDEKIPASTRSFMNTFMQVAGPSV